MTGPDNDPWTARNFKIGFALSLGSMVIGLVAFFVIYYGLTDHNIGMSALVAFLVMAAVYYPAVLIAARRVGRRNRQS